MYDMQDDKLYLLRQLDIGSNAFVRRLSYHSFWASQILDEDGNQLSHLYLKVFLVAYVWHHLKEHLVCLEHHVNDGIRNLVVVCGDRRGRDLLGL